MVSRDINRGGFHFAANHVNINKNREFVLVQLHHVTALKSDGFGIPAEQALYAVTYIASFPGYAKK
jgi:hypothetical protein